MGHRAWAFDAEMTQMTLVDVGEKALHLGHRLPDGRMIARAAWAYEYRGVYVLGRVEQCALAHYQQHSVAPARKAPAAAPQRAKKTRKVAGVSPVAVILDEASTWRSDRLVAAIANPY